MEDNKHTNNIKEYKRMFPKVKLTPYQYFGLLFSHILFFSLGAIYVIVLVKGLC